MNNPSGKLVVVTGFSGAGKDTLINLFLQKRSDFGIIVTHSTRPPRPGEIPGVHHHFVNKEEFELLIEKGEMLEYVRYGSFYKGTSKIEFEKIMEGKNLIWRVDILRAAVYEETFRKVYNSQTAYQIISNSIKIFIKVQNNEIARKRYLHREKGKANHEEFQKRLQRDVYLFEKYKYAFPHVILNKTGYPQESAAKMDRLINSHFNTKK